MPNARFDLGLLIRRPEVGAFIGLAFVFGFFAFFGNANFVLPIGAASYLNVAANLGIVALPVGLLMIAGELDISIGAMIPAGAMTVAIVSGHYGAPIVVGIGASLLLGFVIGLINGILTIRTGVPSLIVTLGTLFAVQGLVLGVSVALTGSTSVPLSAPDWIKTVFGSYVANSFQVTIFWWLAFVVMCFFVLHMSRYGNWIFAMGGDRESARNVGIPTERLTVALFATSSMSASFVGMCQTILYSSAQVSGGMSYIFNSIVTVVVGGVLLTGGFGSVVGIFFGTLTFAVVSQGIYFTQFDANWASLIIGVLLLLAVLTNNTFRKMALSYSPKKGRTS
ncbi:ABC transporter permease [Phyllobacterium sp. YR531]|uniref:ABC transporter permease n=1 Tax=Phyllobacterium sp. YR531 TaxID=1144343 RepID=UPI0005930929|nr:ABC transporter permease [Phyllobacterium sp. YR531]